MIGPLILSFLLFVVYSAWISGPYLRSIVIRDAAVTAWSHVVTAPIEGTVIFGTLNIGRKVGDVGNIAWVRNEHISNEAIDAAQLRLDLAQASEAQAEKMVTEIEQLEDDRRATKDEYAKLFRAQLDTRIGTYRTMITLSEERLEVMKVITARKERLASSGTGSINASDEVQLRLNDVKLALDELRGDLSYALRRRQAADRGIFLDDSGSDPDWVLENRIGLKLEKKKAREEHRAAEIESAAAQAALERTRTDYRRLSEAEVKAPPGSILWRLRAVSGMAVSEGAPVAELVDCKELLVDMPISDAEASLITTGDPAVVVLEGEKRQRSGKVLLVRGSASPLDQHELVALAKGRRKGLAHVLLELEVTEEDATVCPVGRAAHVDLPGVGLIDVILARLRF
jgi:hypothetical protein